MSQLLQNNGLLWFRSRLEAQMQMSQHSWAVFSLSFANFRLSLPFFCLRSAWSQKIMSQMSQRTFTRTTTAHIHRIPDVLVQKLQNVPLITAWNSGYPQTTFCSWTLWQWFSPVFCFTLNLSPNQASPSCCIAANDPHSSPVRPLQHLSLLRPLDPGGTHTRWPLHIKISARGRLHQVGVGGEHFQKVLWGAITVMCYITHEANKSLEMNIQKLYCFSIAWVLKFAVLIWNSCRIMSGCFQPFCSGSILSTKTSQPSN